MKAIYKRELKSYFSSVIGWLFISAVTLISGIFFVLYNLMTSGYNQGSYSTIEPALFYAALGLVIFVPVLTMKVMADERRQKTDQLILTSPVSLFKVVMGKYFALLTIFAIPVAVMSIYPLIMSRFGDVSFKLAYSGILGFVLYGAALIAIGLFISSITEMQIIAAIISTVIMLVGFFMGTITSMISQDGNILTDILKVFYTMGPLNDIMAGQLALSSIVYYVSIIVLFLFLTCQSVQKRRWSASKNTIGTSVFSTLTIAIVLVLVVFVNLLANVITTHVPAATVDTSTLGIYSISDKTEKMLKKLDKDITIYVMSSKGKMTSNGYNEYVVKTLERYEAASDHIDVEYKDVSKNPNFYKSFTSTNPTEGSLIVYNKENKKSKVIDLNDVFVQDQMAAMYGQSSYSAYDAEGQIDSAIAYVQSNDSFTIYQVEGHKETVMDEQNFGGIEHLTDIINKHNGTIKKINLASKEAQKVINGDDCAVLLLMGPQKDYTKFEANLVKKYLEEGGKVIAAFESWKSCDVKKPNFNSIFREYNIKVENGAVAEQDPNFYAAQYTPYFAFGEGKAGFASNISGSIFTPFSIGLKQKDKNNSDITYTALSSSSNSAFLTREVQEQPGEGKGSVDGPFDWAVSVEKNVDATKSSSVGTDKADTKKAEMLVFSSVYTLLDNADESMAGANIEVVNNALDQYIDTDVVSVSVPQKSLQMPSLKVSAMAVRICVIVFVILIPIGVLLFGIIHWAVRRKK